MKKWSTTSDFIAKNGVSLPILTKQKMVLTFFNYLLNLLTIISCYFGP